MHTSSQRFLADYISGKDEAARRILDRYADRLTALARSRLSDQLKSRVDPEEIVQSALRSFFRKADHEQVAYRRNGDLWRLLAAITVHKVLKRVEYEKAQKRDPGREIQGELSLDELSREPSHEDALILIDELTAFMQTLRHQERHMLEARLKGECVGAIALKESVSEAKVRRVLKDVQRRLEARFLAE